ncbi:hypothetical protein SYNPS1DRAFT_31181 [Syncephalis pseudoplumigaleata]|uniref:SET domain-containing protein n=1 Tax=Syncephalis pseudoplumigaleata TaxID=1712513 RepID=A0A4P9YW10_9FUNG|nr:hypothetical protein SYNPS1DRAFT_31181 [Syncephalis pseudoplumigaleata]|eukprot:RKP23120.1 hypothetical protein SYNPS1DRAFT_31181 [Syncephalis pseudoplumigaleata]
MTIKDTASSAQMAANYRPSHPEHFRVEHGTDGDFTSRLVACKDYPSGSLIVKLDADTPVPVAHPVYTTVQTGEAAHVELNCDLTYMNHSCYPNVQVNTSTWEFIAARDIAAGEELTFFYPSTEWSMEQPFDCWCGADKCLGKVCGAKDAPKDILNLNHLNDHIIQLLAKQAGSPEVVEDLITF